MVAVSGGHGKDVGSRRAISTPGVRAHPGARIAGASEILSETMQSVNTLWEGRSYDHPDGRWKDDMTRKLLLALVALAALAAATTALAATVRVSITDAGLTPKNITVTAGDTVTWRNDGKQNHQVVATTGAFASPVLRPGQSFSFKFNGRGRIDYRDALNPTRTGSVNVKAPPPPPAGVSIGESQPIVIAGSSFHLTGAVSTGAPNQTIEVYQQPFGQASFSLLTTVKTTTGGYWDLVVTPTILTTYYVNWAEKKVKSTTDMIQVRPRVSIAYNRTANKFTARLFGIAPKSGRSVYIQRLSTLGQWINTKKCVFAGTNTTTCTAVLPKGAFRYRLFLTVNQAGSGYLGSWSGTLLIGTK
jgi:plastocyanin